MGIIVNRCKSSPYSLQGSNPNPSNYIVSKATIVKGPNSSLLVMLVVYPDCTNFEGKKILVYKTNLTAKEFLNKTRKLDPHFSTNELSPIARFAPSADGWSYAINFAKSLA